MKPLLIADDSQDKIDFLRDMIANVPELFDVEVVTAMTTEDALEKLSTREFGAGLIDYNIPSHNGPHIIREWRKMEKERNTGPARVILFTSAGGDLFADYEREALEAGADHAISQRRQGQKHPYDHILAALRSLEPHVKED